MLDLLVKEVDCMSGVEAPPSLSLSSLTCTFVVWGNYVLSNVVSISSRGNNGRGVKNIMLALASWLS